MRVPKEKNIGLIARTDFPKYKLRKILRRNNVITNKLLISTLCLGLLCGIAPSSLMAQGSNAMQPAHFKS